MPSNIDWIAVQSLRSEGKSVAELSEKFGVSGPTIYAHTKAPKLNGSAPKLAPRAKRIVKGTAGGDLMRELRGERERHTLAIAAIDSVIRLYEA